MAQSKQKSEDIVFTKRPYVEDLGPRRIKSMQFSMFSGSDILKAAEVQVYQGRYYGSSEPIEGGLLDLRMGPPNKGPPNKGTGDKGWICATCHGDFAQCPGHYGYLSLALPVYNVGYLSMILDILKCICKSCSRILLEENLRKDYLKKMRSPKVEPLRKTELMKLVVKKCNTIVKCSRCGYINGKVKKGVSALGIIHDRSKSSDENDKECRFAALSHTKEPLSAATYMLNPVTVLSLFRKISNEDCELLYISERPEKLIITVIAVPPTVIRPSVLMDGSQSNENDITERLKRIIEANATLHQELLETSTALKSLASWDTLQFEFAQYINSDVRGVPYHMQVTKPLSGLVQRLKGKQGRFRGNLSGKRVEYTGRTVISPDPNLKITEVAIPIHMAKLLSYPERVSCHNIEKLRQCVRNGTWKYPGAKTVRKSDNSQPHYLFMDYRKRLADELKIGWIVDRNLEDGDIVLFNRQPSLHRMSIMCHRARIMPWRTLRFNESVCNPYNADFDGDEMNLHVPQTEEARTEALMLMGVQNNLCTPKNGEILVASTQDFLTSSFLITRKDTFYDRANFSLMCSYMGDGMDHIDLPTPAIFKPVELWTGKQLFTILLRPRASLKVYLNLTVKEKNYSKPEKGERERETMCPNDGFVYFKNSELISGQLGKATLGNGNKDGLYSVLLRDYKAHAAATCMTRLAKLSARWIGNHGFSIGIDDVQPKEKLNEEKGNTLLVNYRKCDRKIHDFNEGKLKLQPGCDAAQTLEAEISGILNKIRDLTARVCMETLHWRNSPLIMSQCGSKGSPINISQMVACVGQQSVGGHRAPNGFIERSLPHFPRKSKTPAAKGFVANSFYSGLTATEFFFHTMAGREGLVDTAVKTADTGYMSRRLMKALEDLSIQYDDTVRNASGGIVQFFYGDDGMDPAAMEGKNGFPLNFDRLLMKVKATCPAKEDRFLSVDNISDIVEEQLSEHEKYLGDGCSEAFKKSLRGFLENHLRESKHTIECFKKNSVGEKSEVLEEIANKISGVTQKQLKVFLETCFTRYRAKRVEAGTAIGAIGAQSIGEPGTQMTLKTFHFAGVASMNITQGVPRIKEIINGAKKISTPIITAELEHGDNINAARMVKGRIEKTVLGQVAKSIKIVMTSRLASIVITLDMEIIQDAQLCIDANTVRESILQTPRINLNAECVRVLDVYKLEVLPPKAEAGKSGVHFQLHSLKSVLPFINVKGIKSVERAVIAEKEKKKGEEIQRFNVLVEGNGLQDVMGTEGVDGRNTKSNHVIEVQQILGIEAARKCIIDEIKQTMECHGMSIDIRHMMLLADVMTSRGEVLGITRFGVQKMGKSILMLASFERTSDHLFSASVNGRDDKIEGVSECIIMGIPMQIGTGIIKVMQRVDSTPMLTYGSDPILS
ncbi:DNA-directed RNA polymerase III subunit rpc1 isoform X1 [Tripterygium wilfordii]|uniref:DNA-directed RNA polymerase subunit n=1 Tax=Tripterygium wilfordii TaxID=458696 RepID=A0A7J7BZT1_TRIWF|nr:DNA-directed RNA polymerase III subunit 1 [Tripterygium wilfordii]XP_038693895.1 DNA-directed RNA polymerase III subunit 1 [Tripterygium wilfordii]XP_038693896.1 DNA-directed RNA polymerase III subunit 1 [Tripterygium wilfordii]KAF5727410.1 DNA-directed RNA polymerase III subunit rpc1 isoform X1 [Tripterygium wilfordii]